MEQILLDFHYINYEFCKDNQFSNEKISTFLAIMDFLLHYMMDRQMLPEEGFKLLKKVLERHSLQRPPFSMLIFDQSDIQKIIDFTLKTFFRHFSLYEFSFKPRRELVLKCEPFIVEKFNAEQHDL
jgi:CRISPR/Cas system CSM-associated protein Csm2 small subunit